jgi:hypothetical protein
VLTTGDDATTRAAYAAHLSAWLEYSRRETVHLDISDDLHVDACLIRIANPSRGKLFIHLRSGDRSVALPFDRSPEESARIVTYIAEIVHYAYHREDAIQAGATVAERRNPRFSVEGM